MGKLTVSSETAFSYPAETVYDFVTDPRNWTKVYPHHSPITGVETLPLPVGHVFHEGPPNKLFTWRLQTARRPTKWIFQSIGLLSHDPDVPGSGFEGLMTITYTFLQPGEGITLFHREMMLEMPKRAPMPEGMIRVFEPTIIDGYHDAVAAALAKEAEAEA